MKRIGVISDTHLRGHDPDLARRLAEPFAGVDLILHAGDLVNIRVLEALESEEVKNLGG